MSNRRGDNKGLLLIISIHRTMAAKER